VKGKLHGATPGQRSAQNLTSVLGGVNACRPRYLALVSPIATTLPHERCPWPSRRPDGRPLTPAGVFPRSQRLRVVIPRSDSDEGSRLRCSEPAHA
jgi:hypothetical protein